MIKIVWRFQPILIENALRRILDEPIDNGSGIDSGRDDEHRARLRQAMHHAVFSGGKRLRSQLVLEAAGAVGGPTFDVCRALPAACALELIHAYSLVHDDLPSMDNADTRRGRPSCHKAFDEATAILAGDALLTLAFETLATGASEVEDGMALRAVAIIARAAGEAGMVGGQSIDIGWSGEHTASVSGEQLLQMHALKTGALIRAAAEVGALLGGGSAGQIGALRAYGEHLGRAFQIFDDLLDVEGDPQLTGKVSSDIANQKITAPTIFGLERARQMAQQASDAALATLETFDDSAATLRQLARFVVQRNR